jgi:hypothetical protein
MSINLAFGYKAGIPDDAVAAWGARWIVTQDGYIDFVPDRQDADGPDAERRQLLDLLNAGAGKAAQDRLRELLQNGEVHTRREAEVELYADDRVRVVGNTNASAGYFYVAAYLIPETA